MAIQFHNGKILFVDGAIAMDPACCCGSATYTTRAVAVFRGGSGDTSGDWEFGLGASTSSISSTGQYAWSNTGWDSWSLDYSGAGGTLTLTLGAASIAWTPGTAIPNDASNWRLKLEISVDPAEGALVLTQNATLHIDGDDFAFDDLSVQSPAADATAILGPHQLGNQAWTISDDGLAEVLMSWNGSIPTGSKMLVTLSLQQED